MQPLDKLQPVPFRILRINDSEFAIPVGSKLWLGDESNPAVSQFAMGLPQILHIEADMTGAELMFVQVTLPGRRIDEMNQFDLMVSRKAHEDQLSMRPGNSGVIPFRWSQGVDAAQDAQPQDPGVEAHHSLQVLDHDSGVVKSLDQSSLLWGAVNPQLPPLTVE